MADRLLNGLFAAAVVAALLADSAHAHSGRRFAIEVVDGRVQAQGINSGPDDGAPIVRPYVNSLHDHWQNVQGIGAVASLPGFDITPSSSVALAGHRLDIEWLRVREWLDPPLTPSEGLVPGLTPLPPDHLLSVHFPSTTLTSDTLGTAVLAEEIVFGGVRDIDLVYQVNRMPQGSIHVLDFRLVPHRLDGLASPILPSATVHVLLSPDGVTPQERLHHASLYLESYLASVPEPSSLLLIATCLAVHAMRLPRKPSGDFCLRV
ncbi:MAG: hypothetical protein KDA37_00015 [Planctomycetales bacterium]|nr:hypothetical protein [Planctomycetales bacterium]